MPMTAPIAKPVPAEPEVVKSASPVIEAGQKEAPGVERSSSRKRQSNQPRTAQPKGLSKQDLARRLVASLAPHLPPIPEQVVEPKEERPVSQSVVAEAALVADEPETLTKPAVARELRGKPQSIRQAPAQKPVADVPVPARPAPDPAPDLRDSYELLTGALVQAQDVARQTALQLADARLQAANSLIGLQQKLLEIVHSNIKASFAMAQKIVAAPNLGDAMTLHRRYAQDQILALTEQATELRNLSAELGQAAPWMEFWKKPSRS